MGRVEIKNPRRATDCFGAYPTAPDGFSKKKGLDFTLLNRFGVVAEQTKM